MNPTLVYQECLKTTPTDTTAEQIEKAKAEMDQSIAWKQWNMLPQTQEFRRILADKMEAGIKICMQNPSDKDIPLILRSLDTINKILNSVMINGRYETPTT